MATVALQDPRSGPGPRHAQAGRAAPRLRVGLVVDGRMQPRWLADAFARVARSDYADVVLLAIGEGPPSAPWAWRIYNRLDGWIFSVADAAAPASDIAALLPRAQVLSISDEDGASTCHAWLTELRLQRLDVLFSLGERNDAIFDGLARHGVWRFQVGNANDAQALAGAREVADGRPVSSVRLVARLRGREHVAYQSCSRTVPFSAVRNRHNLLRRMAAFPDRVLRRLHRCGDAWLDGSPRASPAALPAIDRRGTHALGALRSLASVGLRMAWRGAQKLGCVEQWFIGYRFDGGRSWPQEPGGYTCLVPPRDRFWADPFPLRRDGRCCIFFEELVFAAGKAHIAMLEIGRDGRCSQPVRVLERDYHLSYPFLIEHGGELFMVPETGQNRSVELYRCIEFPHRWRLEKVLLSGMCCVDASFHQADGRWWMFVNIGSDSADLHDELHLYYADDLLGEWRPHRANPVKSDVRNARSAGRLFERAGRLYRPAQICAPLYGSGIVLNEVAHLSPQAYQERQVGRIVPRRGCGVIGLHTLNRAGTLSVIDGFMRRPRFGALRPDLMQAEALRPLYVPEPALVGGN